MGDKSNHTLHTANFSLSEMILFLRKSQKKGRG